MNLVQTPPPTGSSIWVGYKIYPGKTLAAYDVFTLETFPALVAEVPHHAWFFMRHIDEDGPHLRLRFQIDQADVRAVNALVGAACERAFLAVPQRPPSKFLPLVESGPVADSARAPLQGPVKVVPFEYEPEFEKFGGTLGMPIAETIFEVSSRIALRVLDSPDPGFRKTIAPYLMEPVPRCMRVTTDIPAFWRAYARYWLGGESAYAASCEARFERKHVALDPGYDLCLSPQLGASPLPEIAAEWSEAIAVARAGYERVGATESMIKSATTNFVHLMNNRLGFLPLEEAYLATLVRCALETSTA